MTRVQARRLALWSNGCYMVAVDHAGFGDDDLDEEQADKVLVAQLSIGRDMIARSGIPADADRAEAIRMVLKGQRV
jgi:hypothetical protein